MGYTAIDLLGTCNAVPLRLHPSYGSSPDFPQICEEPKKEGPETGAKGRCSL